jgi:hypothetical protein
MKVYGQLERAQAENILFASAPAATTVGRLWFDTTNLRLKVADGSSNQTVIFSGIAQIVNADVNAAAAIAGTKISPDFGSQNILTTGRAAIGGSGNASHGLSIQSTGLTGIDQRGLNVVPVLSSGSTSFGTGVVSIPTTAAASFTVGLLANFYSGNPTLGAASAVTRQVSYYSEAPTRGTNNAYIADNTCFHGKLVYPLDVHESIALRRRSFFGSGRSSKRRS